eukprot:1415014-Prymnesium_polylepis.3
MVPLHGALLHGGCAVVRVHACAGVQISLSLAHGCVVAGSSDILTLVCVCPLWRVRLCVDRFDVRVPVEAQTRRG